MSWMPSPGVGDRLPAMRYNDHILNPFNNASNTYHDWISSLAQSSHVLTFIGVTALFIFYIFAYFDFLPATVSRSLWNLFVFVIPNRFVLTLDRTSSSSKADLPMAFTSFQTKSDAMQRILGLDKTSLYSILPRARSLSGLGVALLGGKESIPPGLGNWDNSCYQNSVIQGLASLQSFESFIDHNVRELNEQAYLSTHIALKDIMARLNDPAHHGQKLWIPPELKSMSSWQQQDAQEYFSKIVDQLDREIRQASKRLTNNLGLKNASSHEHVLGVSDTSEPGKLLVDKTNQNASLRNPLEGLLAQRVGCMRCGWTEGLSLIPFNCLTVSLGKNWEYDIRECLDDYMSLEPIEGVECAKCTLLRTKEQLGHLLQQIDEDNDLNVSQKPLVSDVLRTSVQTRLDAVQEALDEEDFSEKTLSKKCHIPVRNRISATKSRQAVVARAPKSLVVHVNRSVFDENTGVLRKNHADVRFPQTLDLDEWCLGTKILEEGKEAPEIWDTDPQLSMLPRPGITAEILDRRYELQAVVTHYGRHENGHYICYRKYPIDKFPANVPDAVVQADGEKVRPQRWFRLSDEDVQMVSEKAVFSQGGVFMLFYELIDESQPGGTSIDELDQDISGNISSKGQNSLTTTAATEVSTGEAGSTVSANQETLLTTSETSVSSTSVQSRLSDGSLMSSSVAEPDSPSDSTVAEERQSKASILDADPSLLITEVE
jgi:ubiquitin carboxyl-terminal hydrolase 1